MKEWQTPEVTEIELQSDEDVLQNCSLPSAGAEPAPICDFGVCPGF